MKREAEQSTDHYLVVSCTRWHGRTLDRPGTPKHIVRVHRCLEDTPVCETFNSRLWQSFHSILRVAVAPKSSSQIFETYFFNLKKKISVSNIKKELI